MLKILLLCLFSTLLLADIKSETGSGATQESAIENAKEKILLTLHREIALSVGVCLPFVSDEVGFDASDYEVIPLGVSSISLFEDGVNLEAEFDVEVKNDHIRAVLEEACVSERKSRARNRKVSAFFSQFHLGVGVTGWPPTVGGEVYAEYRHDSDDIFSNYSIYITASHGLYQQGEEWGSVTLAGAQVRLLSFIMVGYEQVLEVDAAKNTVKEPTSAFVWGLVYSPSSEVSSFEGGFLFKDLDSNNTLAKKVKQSSDESSKNWLS